MLAGETETEVLQTFLTGLREGLEAALVIGILITFLVRGGYRDRLPALWAGVAAAIALSLGFGAVLHFTSANMSFEAQEAFGGILSILAVGFVTWMVFWMKKASATIKGELEGKMQVALEFGAIAIALAAFVAVGREGLETALFLFPTFQAQGAGAGPALGAVMGIFTAVVIGVLIYRGAVHLNLQVFFKVTGAALIVIAAGVLAYGIHDLQEAAILPGLNNLAIDLPWYDPASIYGALMKGIFNFAPQMTVLEVTAYLLYLIPTMTVFLMPTRTAPSAAPVESETLVEGSGDQAPRSQPAMPRVRSAKVASADGVRSS